MNRLFLKYLLEKNVSQENLAFINSIRSNSKLRSISLQEIVAPPTQGMMTNPSYNNGVPTYYQSNYQTGVAYDQFGNPVGWTASDDFFEMLRKHEGVRTKIYKDSLGRRAIGIGFDLDTPQNIDILRRLFPGINIKGILSGEVHLTMQQIEQLFQITVQRAYNDCLAIFPNFNNLPRTVQDVLVNMSFNLGRTKLLKFKEMIAAVNSGDWAAMAREMKDSKWFEQVGGRSRELYRIIMQFAQQQASGGGTNPQQGGGGMPQRPAPPPKPPAAPPPGTGTTPPQGGRR
jgi:lysozyme